MKQTLQILTLMLFTVSLFAQVTVTVSVDASKETVDGTGVHVAGNWDSANEWDPTAFPMNDNGDGTWSLDLTVAENTTFEYKFLLGNDWSLGNEGINDQSSCIVGDGNANRVFATGTEDVTIPTVCYNSCGACTEGDQKSVSFIVDLSMETTVEDSVILSGSFPSMWNEAYIMTSYKNDGVYAITLPLDPGSYEYKFRNGPGGWESVPNECAPANGNRGVTVETEDIFLDADCINKCGPCVLVNTVNVIMQVDMTNVDATIGISADGVSVAGSFQSAAGLGGNWSPGTIFLTDDDNDMVYEISFTLPEGSYHYKFLNGKDWGTEESIPMECVLEGTGNREMIIAGEDGSTMMVGPFCFSECGAECSELKDPVNVTFRVDMTAEFLATEGLYVAGDFIEGAKWDKDSLLMVENSEIPGIYEYTFLVRPGKTYAYKYFNNGMDSGQETADLIAGGCGVDNGFGGSNRLLDLTTLETDTILPAFIFNSCDLSTLVNNKDIEYASEISTYPNPVTNVWTVNFNDVTKLAHKVEIYNVTGQAVYTNAMSSNNVIEVNMNTFSSGMYFAKIINENGESTSVRFIKE